MEKGVAGGAACIVPGKQRPFESQQEAGTVTGCLALGKHKFLGCKEAPPPPCAWNGVSHSSPLIWRRASRHSTRERGSAFPSLAGIWVGSCPPKSHQRCFVDHIVLLRSSQLISPVMPCPHHRRAAHLEIRASANYSSW